MCGGLGVGLNLVGERKDVMQHNMSEEHCLQFCNQMNSSTDTGICLDYQSSARDPVTVALCNARKI